VLPRLNDPLKGRKVAVLGFARQGRALARWLPTIGAKVIVSDSKTRDQLGINYWDYPDVEFVLGDHPPSLLHGVDVLCISGGVPLDLPIVRLAQQEGIRITNDAQLFMERCPAPIIGITGSAGKTTTTTLVGEIMKKAGFKTWVGGNIGDVLLDDLAKIRPDDRVVMELSSFQLELMTISPAIAAVLNVTPNHLDRHGTMEAYMRAKAQIVLHQRESDIAVLCWDDAGSRELEDAVPGRIVWFTMQDIISDGAFMAGQRLIVVGDASEDGDPHILLERPEIPLRGDHNVMNVLAACAITGAAGVSPTVMADVIREFKGVPHRLETVRVLDGVTYINDSIATAPERVIAAVNSYTEPIVLLLGGRDKKLPWDDLIVLALARTRHIIAFGELAELVEKKLRLFRLDLEGFTRVNTLEEAVNAAKAVAEPGDVVLLSPGGTSYDAYTDFAERGDHFRRLVAGL
jgi:UDP-N-acetylmuramoylalanine--D-glutamate ligase